MKEFAKHKKILRFGLLGYSLIWLVYVMSYIALHHKFYQIDWLRYNNDSTYHAWVDKEVLPLGVLRITGNQTQMHDFWLILPFFLGMLLCLLIFIFFWRNYIGRTFVPLLAFAGYLLPLLPFNDVNLLVRMSVALPFILFGSMATVWSTKAFARVK
ncbi:MAG: transporter [Streptococcaceae bacterium]|jgi:hypothetical protein|nr:transporter [Streptococcaceae bacterium]